MIHGYSPGSSLHLDIFLSVLRFLLVMIRVINTIVLYIYIYIHIFYPLSYCLLFLFLWWILVLYIHKGPAFSRCCVFSVCVLVSFASASSLMEIKYRITLNTSRCIFSFSYFPFSFSSDLCCLLSDQVSIASFSLLSFCTLFLSDVVIYMYTYIYWCWSLDFFRKK